MKILIGFGIWAVVCAVFLVAWSRMCTIRNRAERLTRVQMGAEIRSTHLGSEDFAEWSRELAWKDAE